MRILLVENDPDHRERMRLALVGHDITWQVDEVASGDEAQRRLAKGESYDLVFLADDLGERNGLEALAKIRRGEAPPPVVLVTDGGDKEVAAAFKNGAYDYVVKTVDGLKRLPEVARRLAEERARAEEELSAPSA